MIDTKFNTDGGAFQDVQIEMPFAPVLHPLPPANQVQISKPFPTPRRYECKEYYGAEDVAKIIGVTRQNVMYWHQQGLFTADTRAHDGRYLYEVERVMQLKAVYRANWTRGSYEPPLTEATMEINLNFKQYTENLPTVFLAEKRFFAIGRKDAPPTGWNKPENQILVGDAAQNGKFVAVDISGHDIRDDYALIDFDHVLDETTGKFVDNEAQKWFYYIQNSFDGYAERSVSGTGIHVFLKPSKGKFGRIVNKDGEGVLWFNRDSGAKLEIFYKAAARYCLVTGELFNTNSKIIMQDEFADDVLSNILAAIRPPSSSTMEQKTQARRADLPVDVQSLVDAINAITPQELMTKNYLHRSEKGAPEPTGFICPWCGSGTHVHKTGALTFYDEPNPHFACHACSNGGDVIKFLSKVYGVDNRGKDFFALIRRAADDFNITYDPNIFEYKPNTNPEFDNPEVEAAFRAHVMELAGRDDELKKRLVDWQKVNGKINPKILPEIKAAAEYVEGLTADNFDIADAYDLTRNQQIALLSYYLPQHRQQFFDVLTDAVKFARQAIKELEKQTPSTEPDDRLKKLAKITIGDVKKAVDELKRDLKNKHRTYLTELEAKVIQEERERENANFKPEQTKQKISDCPVDLKLPRGVYFDDKGIRRVDWDKPYKSRSVIAVATTPIIPTAIYREPGKHTTAYEVAIKARGFWRRIMVDGDELADSKKIIRLAKDGGALIESAQHLCKYFAQIIGGNQNVLPEIKFYTKTGWQDDKDFTFFAYPSAGADYIVHRSGFDFDKSLAVRGNADKWKEAFAAACDKSVHARIFLGYVLLAPLIRPLNLQNAQLLLHCKFNNGKSALQKLAASIYGNPKELIKSFSATLKYRQGVANAYCDLPTFLDEPEAGADKNHDANYSQMIYDYAEGKSNQANKRNGVARESENFYGTRVVTSERPLLKPSDKNGAYKRMPQITCKKLFERDFAIYLHNVTSDNYGHFGKPWVDFISAHWQEILASFHEVTSLFTGKDIPVEETARDAIIAAVVAVQYFKVMSRLQAQFDVSNAAADVDDILAGLPTKDDLDEASRALNDLRSLFAVKEKSFVHEGDNKNADDAYTNAETGGDKPATTFDTSGKVFRNNEVAIFPTVLRNWLEKELHYSSMDAIVAEWAQRGLLRCSKGKRLCSTRIGKRTWAYLFKAGVLFNVDTDETTED